MIKAIKIVESFLPLYRRLFELRLNCTFSDDDQEKMIEYKQLAFHPNRGENNKGGHVKEVSPELLYFARFQVTNQMTL